MDMQQHPKYGRSKELEACMMKRRKGERDHQEKRLTDEKSEGKVLKVTQRKRGGGRKEPRRSDIRRTKETSETDTNCMSLT